MKRIIIAFCSAALALGAYSQTSVTLERKDGTKIHTSLQNFVEVTFTDEDETTLDADTAEVYDGFQLVGMDTNGMNYVPMQALAPHIWTGQIRLVGMDGWNGGVRLCSPDYRTSWGLADDGEEITESGEVTLVKGEFQSRYFITGTYGFIFNDVTGKLRFTRLFDEADVKEKIVEVPVEPKSDYTVALNIGGKTVDAVFLSMGMWKATANVSTGDTFTVTRTDKEGVSVVWGAPEAAEAALTGTLAGNAAAAYTLPFETGRYEVIFNEISGGFAFVRCPDVTLRTLTFEDSDYRGSGNVFGTEKPWSGLIDSKQYGGELLYGSKASQYSWYDEGNTELCWDGFNKSGYMVNYAGGGYAISNYVGAPASDYTRQLNIPFGDGTNNFCMAFNREDNYSAKTVSPIYFIDGTPRVIRSIDVTNSSYAAGSLMYGDGFAPKAKEGTEFLVNIKGTRLDGSEVVVQYHLCKDTDILTDRWVTVDCTPLGAVVAIEVYVTGSDDLGGSYGLNSPGYVAFDNIVVEF